jgi:serine/threonine protein kinase/tetratricopeptide (TPR) repeat protein
VTETVVSHYRVRHQLGEGGMGVVYAAEDLRLGREVAIKFLRADEPDQDQWLARFEREARLASALKHPHICTIHELGEQGGRPFIVMELLEGRTIKQMLENGPLSIAETLEFAVQIGDALVAAHERGIIHRDVKPANLFVTHGDLLKVLDFGLAKIATRSQPITTPLSTNALALPAVGGPEVTATGAAVGTAAYMSPEQAMGRPVDARTDLFSFGSVLYEMVTGRRAFPGDTAAIVLQRLVNGDVVPPHALEPDMPERLEAIILRALQTDISMRYQSAREMLADLRSLAREVSADVVDASDETSNEPERTSNRRWVYVSLVAALVLAAGVGVWRWLMPAKPLSDRDSLMVATFANNTGEPVFDETLLTALKVHLGQSPFLDIVGDDRIAETLRLMGRPTDQPLTHEVAREVCQRLRVKGMLEGTVSRLGSNYVVTLGATDCESGSSLAREQGEATSASEVLQVLGSLSSSMRTILGESLPSIRQFDVPIEQATTKSLEALRAYALGMAERRRGRELESVAFFNQAIELDPDFASAYGTLSTVYGSLGELRRSEEYAQLAYDRHKRVSERERLFIEYQYHDRVTGDSAKAAETLEVWKLSYPRDSRPVNALALIHMRFGRYDRAVAEAQEALRRTPGHPFPLSNLAAAYRGLGNYDDARKVAEEAVMLGVATTPTRRLLYQLGVIAGDGSDAVQLEWSKGRPREFDITSARAQVAAYQGRLRLAMQLYTDSVDKALARGLNGTAVGFLAHMAWTEALFGDPAKSSTKVREILDRAPEGSDGGETLPRMRAAIALGLSGLARDARDLVAPAERRYPNATLVQSLLAPLTSAAIALDRNRPDDAIGALEATRSLETGSSAALVPIYLRGAAYLAKRDGPAARAEFERVLQLRGVDPFAPILPMSQLGVARAWALEGDADKSRAAYDKLFELWRDGDADLPVLLRARAEYARVVDNLKDATMRKR